MTTYFLSLPSRIRDHEYSPEKLKDKFLNSLNNGSVDGIMVNYSKELFSTDVIVGSLPIPTSWEPPSTGCLESLFNATKPECMKNIEYYPVFKKQHTDPVFNSMKQQVQDAFSTSIKIERLLGQSNQNFERLKNVINKRVVPLLDNQRTIRVFKSADIVQNIIESASPLFLDIGQYDSFLGEKDKYYILHFCGSSESGLNLLHTLLITYISMWFIFYDFHSKLSDNEYCNIVIYLLNLLMSFNKKRKLSLWMNDYHKIDQHDNEQLIKIKGYIIKQRMSQSVQSFDIRNMNDVDKDNIESVKCAINKQIFAQKFIMLRYFSLEIYGSWISDQFNSDKRAKYGEILVQSSYPTSGQLRQMNDINANNINNNKPITKIVTSGNIEATKTSFENENSLYAPITLKESDPRKRSLMKSLIIKQVDIICKHLLIGGDILLIGSTVSSSKKTEQKAEQDDDDYYVVTSYTNSVHQMIELDIGKDPSEMPGWSASQARELLMTFEKEFNTKILKCTKFGYIDQENVYNNIPPRYVKFQRAKPLKIKWRKKLPNQVKKVSWYIEASNLDNTVHKYHQDMKHVCFAAELSSDCNTKGVQVPFYKGLVTLHIEPKRSDGTTKATISTGSFASNEAVYFDNSISWELFVSDPMPSWRKSVSVIKDPPMYIESIPCISYRVYSLLLQVVRCVDSGHFYSIGITVFDENRFNNIYSTLHVIYDMKKPQDIERNNNNNNKQVKDQVSKPSILPPSIEDDDDDEYDSKMTETKDNDDDDNDELVSVLKQQLTSQSALRKPIPNSGDLSNVISTIKEEVLQIIDEKIRRSITNNKLGQMDVDNMKDKDMGEIAQIRHKIYKKHPSYVKKYNDMMDHILIAIIQIIYSHSSQCDYPKCANLLIPFDLKQQHSMYHEGVKYSQIQQFRRNTYTHYYSHGNTTQQPEVHMVRAALQLDNVFSVEQWNYILHFVIDEGPRDHIYISTETMPYRVFYYP